ncbi:hypothetical protein ERAN111884_01425 [Erysipelothrix anatis]
MQSKSKRSIFSSALILSLVISFLFFLIISLFLYIDTQSLMQADPFFIDDPLSNLAYLFVAIWSFIVFFISLPINFLLIKSKREGTNSTQ